VILDEKVKPRPAQQALAKPAGSTGENYSEATLSRSSHLKSMWWTARPKTG